MRLTLIYNISKYMALLTCLMLQICWFDEKVAEEVWDLATCQWWLTQIIQIWWKNHQQETRLYQTGPFLSNCFDNKLRLSSCMYCGTNSEVIYFNRKAKFVDCLNKYKTKTNINVTRYIHIYFVFGTEIIDHFFHNALLHNS